MWFFEWLKKKPTGEQAIDPRWYEVARLLGVSPEALTEFLRDKGKYVAKHPEMFATYFGELDEVSPAVFLMLWLDAHGNLLTIDRHVTIEDFLALMHRVPLVEKSGIAIDEILKLLPDGLAALNRADEALRERGLEFIGVGPSGEDAFYFSVVRSEYGNAAWHLLDDMGEEPGEYDPEIFVELWPWLADEEPRFPHGDKRPFV